MYGSGPQILGIQEKTFGVYVTIPPCHCLCETTHGRCCQTARPVLYIQTVIWLRWEWGVGFRNFFGVDGSDAHFCIDEDKGNFQ